MIIDTNATVKLKSDQTELRNVWLVDITRHPEAVNLVKQPRQSEFFQTILQGDQDNFREIDPIQFINVGVDGRLNTEKKVLKDTSVDVRVPRQQIPEYEHLAMEADEIKWYKNSGGQWAFHTATAADIERFIQKYLSNAELLTGQRVRNLGTEIVGRINAMTDSQLIKLLQLPPLLAEKFHDNQVIKKDANSFRYTAPEDVVKIVNSKVVAFDTLQNSINLEDNRIQSGVVVRSRFPDISQPGLYRVARIGGPIEKLTSGIWQVDSYGAVKPIPRDSIITPKNGAIYIQKRESPNDWYDLNAAPFIDSPDSSLDNGYRVSAAWSGENGAFLYALYGFPSSVKDLKDAFEQYSEIHIKPVIPYKTIDNGWDDQITHQIYLVTPSQPAVTGCPALPIEEDLIPGVYYEFTGDLLVPAQVERPVYIRSGRLEDYIEYIGYHDGLDDRLIYSIVHGELEPAELPGPISVIGGEVLEWKDPHSYFTQGLVYEYNGSKFIPMTRMTPFTVREGIIDNYVCHGAGDHYTPIEFPDTEGDGAWKEHEDPENHDCSIPEGLLVIKEKGVLNLAEFPSPITVTDGVPSPHVCTSSQPNGGHLLAAAIVGAGFKEMVSQDMIYEEHADDETELDINN